MPGEFATTMFLVLSTLFSCQPLEKEAEGLPPEVIAAWEKGGAIAGWMHADTLGFHIGARQERETPAFLFERLGPGIISQLPMPQRPFGLRVSDIDDTGMTQILKLSTSIHN